MFCFTAALLSESVIGTLVCYCFATALLTALLSVCLLYLTSLTLFPTAFLLLSYCFTTTLLLLYYCFTAALLLYYCASLTTLLNTADRC